MFGRSKVAKSQAWFSGLQAYAESGGEESLTAQVELTEFRFRPAALSPPRDRRGAPAVLNAPNRASVRRAVHDSCRRHPRGLGRDSGPLPLRVSCQGSGRTRRSWLWEGTFFRAKGSPSDLNRRDGGSEAQALAALAPRVVGTCAAALVVVAHSPRSWATAQERRMCRSATLQIRRRE